MTWCSVDSVTPRFALASAAIRCRFVDRFARLKVPPTVLVPWRLPSLGRVPASPVPRGRQYYEGATTSRPRIPGHLFGSLPGTTRFPQDSCSPLQRSRVGGGPARARAHVQPAAQVPACSRVDVSRILSGSQAIRPVPLPRSKTPAEPTIPRHWRSRRCCPRSNDSEGFSMRSISRLLRGFSTCCLRFKNGVAATPARLASGWLAGLCREGVRTLWVAMKGFSSHVRPPFLGLS